MSIAVVGRLPATALSWLERVGMICDLPYQWKWQATSRTILWIIAESKNPHRPGIIRWCRQVDDEASGKNVVTVLPCAGTFMNKDVGKWSGSVANVSALFEETSSLRTHRLMAVGS